MKGLDKVMQTMDLEKVKHHTLCLYSTIIYVLVCLQISGTMAKFEDLFQDLDVHTEVMDSTMSAATTLNTPEDQVTGLMKQV